MSLSHIDTHTYTPTPCSCIAFNWSVKMRHKLFCSDLYFFFFCHIHASNLTHTLTLHCHAHTHIHSHLHFNIRRHATWALSFSIRRLEAPISRVYERCHLQVTNSRNPWKRSCCIWLERYSLPLLSSPPSSLLFLSQALRFLLSMLFSLSSSLFSLFLSADLFVGLSDPYVTFCTDAFGEKLKVFFKTSVVKKNLNPGINFRDVFGVASSENSGTVMLGTWQMLLLLYW